MKKVLVLVLVALLVGMAFGPGSATRVYAQGFGTTWTSSFQVQNLGGAQAFVQVSYYNQDGTLATMAMQGDGVTPYPNPDSATIEANQSYVFFGTTLHVAPGFFGSVVIASSQPIAVVSNVFANTAQQAVDTYVGLQQGGATLYFPMVMRANNTQNTAFTIQNTGSAAASIVVHFESEKVAGGGDKYTGTPADISDTLPVNGAKTYDMTTIGTPTDKWVGSVKVTSSDGTVAGVANNVKVANSAAYEMTSYNGFIGGNETTSVLLPLIQENNSLNRTAETCMNVGTAAADITIAYTPETGSPAKASETVTAVPVNGTAVFLQQYNLPDKFVGSAVVTSAQKLFCVVTQQKFGPAGGRASIYPGLDATKATTKVVYPAIQSKNGNASKGWNYTVPTLSTADGSVAWIKCDFVSEPGNTNIPVIDPKQGSTVVFNAEWLDIYFQHNPELTGQKFVGSATCYTVTSATDLTPTNVKLLGTINLIRQSPPALPRDTQGTYAGFSIP